MSVPPDLQNINEPADSDPSVVMRAEQWQGPLPPPAVLKQYDAVIDGLAERLVSTMEREQSHRHAMEREMLRTHNAMYSRGQFIAGLVAITCIASGFVLGTQGHTSIAIAFVTSGLGQVVIAFLGERKDKTDKL